MVYFVCIFSSFHVFRIKLSRRRRKTVLIPQTNFLRLWHGKKNPWQYALKCFKTILPRTFLCLPCWQRLIFIATTRSSIFYRTIQTTWNSGTPPFHVSVVRHEESASFCRLQANRSKETPFLDLPHHFVCILHCKKEVIDVNLNDHFHAWLHSLGENPMQEAWTSHTLLSSEFLWWLCHFCMWVPFFKTFVRRSCVHFSEMSMR